MRETVKRMEKKLTDYWKIIEDYSIICNILDPRFKLDFIAKKSQKDAIKVFENYFQIYTNHTISSEPTTSAPIDKGYLF